MTDAMDYPLLELLGLAFTQRAAAPIWIRLAPEMVVAGLLEMAG